MNNNPQPDWRPDISVSYHGVTFESRIHWDDGGPGREPENLVGEVRVVEIEDPEDWDGFSDLPPDVWIECSGLDDELVARLIEAYEEQEQETDPW